jgi:hypothetical protein
LVAALVTAAGVRLCPCAAKAVAKRVRVRRCFLMDWILRRIKKTGLAVENRPCNIPLKRPCGTLQRAHQEHLNHLGWDFSKESTLYQ